MELDKTSYIKAIESLDEALDVYREYEKAGDVKLSVLKVLRAGVIQNFEFTYELAWKFMKRWIEMNVSPTALDGASRRELFRQARENLLIEDVDLWMVYHQARNSTSHTYDAKRADIVLESAFEFIVEAKTLLQRLQETA